MEANTPQLRMGISLEEPSEELLEWAKNNIDEDPDKKELLVSELKDLIFARGECNPHRLDDDFLIIFLRARHFIVNLAHRLLVNYYEFKKLNPQYFNSVNLDTMRKIAKTQIISVPPYKDQNERRMMILRLGYWEPSEFRVNEIFQLVLGMLEVAVMEQSFQIKGGIVILDLSNLGFKHVRYATPTITSHIVNVGMRVFPARLEAIHILHQSWVFEIGFAMIKPLIPEIFRNRLIFHGSDMKSLHNYVDCKYLPEMYGGIHKEYSMETWFDDFLSKEDPVLESLIDLGYEDFARLRKKGNE